MLSKDFDLFDTNDCPGCKRLLMAYRYECIRWNGVVWHTECALMKADHLLVRRAEDELDVMYAERGQDR